MFRSEVVGMEEAMNNTVTWSKLPSLLFGVCSLASPLPEGQDHSLVEDIGNVIGGRGLAFDLSRARGGGGPGGGTGRGGRDEEGVPHLKGQ